MDTIGFGFIDVLLVAPIICLFLASLIPITIKVLRGNREMDSLSTVLYALIGLIAAMGFLISTQSAHTFAFSKALVFDGISNFTGLIVLVITGTTLFYSKDSPTICKKQFSEYVFLLLNSAVGMLIVVGSNDLILTFIGIEIMSLCLYLLIAMGNEQRLTKESAFKYFILGSFASAIFLYGVAFVYGSAGSTYLDEITQAAPVLISSHRLFVLGAVMVIVGFGFKVALAPFHGWVPDVYQGSPTPLTSFMATGVKIVVFMAFLRWLLTGLLTGDRSLIFINVLEWLAVLTMLVGNIAAIMQDNLKRMLAYSGIAHSGYAMIGLLAATVGGWGSSSVSGLLLYIFSYVIITIGTFGVVNLFEEHEDTILSIDNLKGVAKDHPLLALAITILMLSLAGIPPTLGFFGKFFVFSAAIKQGFFWLAIWGVINSVISVYYYLKPVVFMYMYEGERTPFLSGRLTTRAFIYASAFLMIFMGFALNFIYNYISQTVSGIF